MSKRRTRKQKVRAQSKPKKSRKVTQQKSVSQSDRYFLQDLRHSLLVIGLILLLELGFWFWLSR